MYILIADDKVIYKKNLNQLNKKMNINLTKEEFKKYNQDFILNTNNDDLSYLKDMTALNNVFVSKLYKKDNSSLINSSISIIILIVQLITLSNLGAIQNSIVKLTETLQKVLG